MKAPDWQSEDARHSLYCGDCLEILPQMEAGSVDAVIADLPYGITACKWDSVVPLEPLWTRYKRVIKCRGVIVLTASQPFASALVMSNLEWFKYEWVWEKDKATGYLDANRKPLKAHENILVFASKRGTYCPQMTDGHRPSNRNGRRKVVMESYGRHVHCITGGSTARFPRSVQKFNTHNSAHGRLHPNQKPVALMEYLIRTYTNDDEFVLDNAMGSGTTGVACVKTGRRFIGIEKEVKYFDIAVKRMEQAIREQSELLIKT